jgi:Glycosyl hydrolases family 38 N-terminal domain/Alpha mannosidase middle domain
MIENSHRKELVMAQNPSSSLNEHDLRQQLAIPADAKNVLVFAENSHWDPNWLLTSEEYFTRFVRQNLDQALDELVRDPRRVYSVECVFFLKRFWDECPQRQAVIRDLVNQGRLRMTSSGVTTADSLLPSEEALMRDFLIGQEWLRSNGMTQEPRLAYFPDSFGYSHALPSLLNAAGFDQAGITRIDGMLFPGCDVGLKAQFYWEGSSAATLLNQEKTLDFIWRDSDGGEIICHWNAYTYGQGDMLAYSGIARVYIFNAAMQNRTDWNVTRRINQYIKELRPISRTPYMFCPIGMDFNAPIPNLIPLLDRYNQKHYPQSGVWVVNAGLSDYLALVDCHRDRLPVLAFDPNPYWTGFYSSRPSLKQLSHSVIDALQLAEQLALLPVDADAPWPDGEAETLANDLKPAWYQAIVSNHHDFITGTATDRVVETEQVPFLKQAMAAAEAAIIRLEKRLPIFLPSRIESIDLPEWRQKDGVIEICTPFYALDLAEAVGGCIVRAWHPVTHRPLLGGLSNDIISFVDSGGVWRMGHELPGGSFTEVARSSQRPAPLVVRSLPGCIEVTGSFTLDGMELRRRLIFRTDTPVIRFSLRGKASEKRTLLARFETGLQPDALMMDEPGGVVSRPFSRKYQPTFWPQKSFVHLQAGDGHRGLALLRGLPGAAACNHGGTLDLITHRNALQEKAFGFIKLPGHPVEGHENLVTQAEYGLLFTQGGSWLDYHLPRLARRVMGSDPDSTTRRATLDNVTDWLVMVDPLDAQVVSVKPADRGEGWIVRILGPAMMGQPVTLRPARQPLNGAWLVDARERDQKALKVIDGSVRLVMPGSIATVRMTWKN